MKTYPRKENKPSNRKKRAVLAVCAALTAVWLGLLLWSACIEKQAHYSPSYEKESLDSIVKKRGEELKEQDYETLFYQTGLGPLAVDELWQREGQQKLLEYQEDFFRDVTVRCERYNAFVRGEFLTEPKQKGERNYKKIKGPQLAPLKEGDILITICSHFLGWRNGHAAIVAEAPKEELEVFSTKENALKKTENLSGRTVESVTLGVESRLRRLDRWRSYPSFVVLRLREDVALKKSPNDAGVAEVGKQAAALAREHFCGLPYRLSAGLWKKPWKPPEEYPKGAGTQCAHMVWSCYQALGFDLDSDGGRLVTPRDLLESPLLEIVQIYGMNPQGFWQKQERR